MKDRPINTKACFASHMGYWAIKPDILTAAVDAWHMGQLPVQTPNPDQPMQVVLDNGVATISLEGGGFKLKSKFGGFSSNEVANVVEDLSHLNEVRTINLLVDSPGGQVSGGNQMADAIFDARKRRRVHGHVVNLAASLGYLAVSQCDTISVDRSALIGCIGVFGVLQDVTKMADKQGIKVHLISTGGIKGKGAPGTPIDDEVLAEEKKHVEHFGDLFVEAIVRGRGVNESKAREWMTGQCWPAEEAVKMGLVDVVAPLKSVMQDLIAGRMVSGVSAF